MVAGVTIAHAGFSGPAMDWNMTGGVLLLMWVVALGVLMWRRQRGE